MTPNEDIQKDALSPLESVENQVDLDSALTPALDAVLGGLTMQQHFLFTILCDRSRNFPDGMGFQASDLAVSGASSGQLAHIGRVMNSLKAAGLVDIAVAGSGRRLFALSDLGKALARGLGRAIGDSELAP